MGRLIILIFESWCHSQRSRNIYFFIIKCQCFNILRLLNFLNFVTIRTYNSSLFTGTDLNFHQPTDIRYVNFRIRIEYCFKILCTPHWITFMKSIKHRTDLRNCEPFSIIYVKFYMSLLYNFSQRIFTTTILMINESGNNV